MDDSILILYMVFVPIIGAFSLPLLGKISAHLRNWIAGLLVAFPFCAALYLVQPVLQGVQFCLQWQLPFSLNLSLAADPAAVGMILVSSFITLVIIVYSWAYISHYQHQQEYYLVIVLFSGAMTGLVFAGNLLVIYLFWEITAFACWRLIGFFRRPREVRRANKAFLLTVFGSLLMLTGFILLYRECGSFELSVLKNYYAGRELPDAAVVLILCGILSKSATLPLHSWLPDAGVAPSPVTALLHAAVLVKIGVYVYLRLFILTVPVSAHFHTWVPVLAGISALVTGGAALAENDIKRIIAYSTVSQIGFIFLGLSAGSAFALRGALLFILMHGLAKAGLFLCAGIVERNMHTKDIRKLGGLAAAMPVTALTFLVCALSLIGVPPLGGFFSKYFVFAGTIAAGQWGSFWFFLGNAVLTLLYLGRVFYRVFLGTPRSAPAAEGSPLMIWSTAFLAFMLLAGGILISVPYQYAARLAALAGLGG